MNVTDEIIGDIKQQKASLIYLGNDIKGKKFQEIRILVIGSSSNLIILISLSLSFS